VDSKRLTVQTKFMELLEPLSERKHNLLASKEIHQFNRDVEDEIVSSPRASRRDGCISVVSPRTVSLTSALIAYLPCCGALSPHMHTCKCTLFFLEF
jgi:hypothetical protein